jgi:hypothetical protein
VAQIQWQLIFGSIVLFNFSHTVYHYLPSISYVVLDSFLVPMIITGPKSMLRNTGFPDYVHGVVIHIEQHVGFGVFAVMAMTFAISSCVAW